MFQTSVDALLTRLADLAANAGIFVASLLVIYLPARVLVVPLVARVLDAVDLDETLRLPFEKVLHASFALFAVFVAITLSGLATFLTATEALTAAATIALGFAAQDVLGNFVSGVFIVLDPKFNIGDWIQWGDREGIVEDISFRVTRVHTFDNELVTVPNAKLTDSTIVNPVAKERLRVNVDFGIGYEDDVDRARDLILDEASRHPEVLDRPGPTVRIHRLGDSAVLLRVRFWIAHPARLDFVRVRSEFTQAVKERFDAEGVEMPYPYRQLTGDIETRTVDGRTPSDDG